MSIYVGPVHAGGCLNTWYFDEFDEEKLISSK